MSWFHRAQILATDDAVRLAVQAGSENDSVAAPEHPATVVAGEHVVGAGQVTGPELGHGAGPLRSGQPCGGLLGPALGQAAGPPVDQSPEITVPITGAGP